VAAHRRSGRADRTRQLASAARPGAEQLDHRPAGPVGESIEDRVDRAPKAINHHEQHLSILTTIVNLRQLDLLISAIGTIGRSWSGRSLRPSSWAKAPEPALRAL